MLSKESQLWKKDEKYAKIEMTYICNLKFT
jgi:hypothetical protein